jgi:hypothetical protein
MRVATAAVALWFSLAFASLYVMAQRRLDLCMHMLISNDDAVTRIATGYV